MVNTKTEPDIIDCDDLDVECVGMKRAPPTYIMLDDEDDSAPVASSSRQPPSLRSASSSQDRRGNPLHEALRGSGRLQQQQARGSRSQMEPPTKKRATNAAIAKLNRPGPSNRKRKEPEVIEISSDEAEGSSSKRTKLDGRESADPILLAPREPPLPDPETDSEDEYANYMASLDIRDESNWLPVPTRDRAEDLTPALEQLAISAPPVPRPQKRIEYVDCRYGPPERIDLGREVDACIFKRFQASKSIKAPPRVRLPQMCQAPLKSSRSRPLYRDLAYNMLGLAQSFRRVASGSITKVVQVPGTILVGSTAWQGNPDYPGDEEEPLGPENMAGNLLMWHKDDIQTIDGHWGTRATSNEPVQKYYTVNDVAFNPSRPDRFVSTGNDCSIQVWDIVDGPGDGPAKVPWRRNTIQLDDVAQDILFRPDHPAVAVSCRNGTVSLFSRLDASSQTSDATFQVAPASAGSIHGHAAGAMSWGRGHTSHLLYTSSEPLDTASNIGYHRAFDVVKETYMFTFNAAESGDAMAIHPTGRTLALITAGDSNSHFLRLYDVHRNARKETVEVPLEPYTKGYNFEVNCASFSPDGIFLALGRNDNITDVYDSRNMERGPLYGFFHDDPNRGVPGSESYGVVDAKWVEGRDGRRLGLITGGNDGCIRLWDCGISALDDTNGRSIAKTDFDVAHFALGDPYKGEKALVVGHCGGGVYIFDRLDGAAHAQ